MKQVIEIPDYVSEAGIRFHWDDDYIIEAIPDSNGFTVRGNAAGLRSLARHLLTIAQENVPEGSHIHPDTFAGLPETSVELTLEKIGT